ncbi:glutathione S-transferase N-terminal domain-containing protein [Caulobacter sp. UC70_42]|uniref:glutathione S-transferase N-terminal domain-containing protein n=1 Tax=Caulobacter sp. UC70_42 TaxID=3374551 RepID=UPI0037582898
MIELYHCHDARSFRALWALEEMGLAYRLHLLPFPPRFLAPEYLAQNPLGTIPLLIDAETRMTESAAIRSISRHAMAPRRWRSAWTSRTTACGWTGCIAARRR